MPVHRSPSAAGGWGRLGAGSDMRGYFITGTDTSVGKTTVTVALLQAAQARGLRAAALKPIESGGGHDGWLLGSAASREIRPPEGPYRLAAPLAPALAARKEGVRIDLEVIARAHAELAAQAPDVLLVEGAGGLLVPIDQGRTTIADVAVRLGHPLVVVAADRLGAINHTLLTIEAAARRGLRVAAVILSAAGGPAPQLENASEIRRLSDVPVLGCLPRIEHASQLLKIDLAGLAERALELDVLFGPRAP